MNILAHASLCICARISLELINIYVRISNRIAGFQGHLQLFGFTSFSDYLFSKVVVPIFIPIRLLQFSHGLCMVCLKEYYRLGLKIFLYHLMWK